MTAPDATTTSLRFLSIKAVKDMVPLSTSGIYQGMRDGTFPKNVQIGPNRAVWIESEIQEWMQKKIRASRGAE